MSARQYWCKQYNIEKRSVYSYGDGVKIVQMPKGLELGLGLAEQS